MTLEKISVWRYNSNRRRAGFWTLIGVGAGAVIGLVTYKGNNTVASGGLNLGAGVSAIWGALLGGLSGVIIGGIVGSAKSKFNIDRNKTKFNDMRNRVLEKAFGNNQPVSKDSTNSK
jgi:hypothetical protein